MIYLLIPISCFILFAWWGWAFLPWGAREETIKGKIDDLDLILSVLMTTGMDDPCLCINVQRRVTWLKMTFPDSVVRLEMPLMTRLQRSRGERYLEIFQGLDLDAYFSSNGGDYDTIECDVEAPPDRAATVIKDAFLRLFEVDTTRAVEFRIFAHHTDQTVIGNARSGNLRGYKPEQKELPVAAFQGDKAETYSEPRAGCLQALVRILLLPIPFLITYFEFGFVAASAVWVVLSLSWVVSRSWRGIKIPYRFHDYFGIMVMVLPCATIYFKDPFYLQSIPTILCSGWAVAELFTVSFNRPHLSFSPKGLPRPAQMRWTFAFVVTFIGAIVFYEYLRATVTLDVWVWFFAFLRLELMLGMMTAMFPVITYMERHDTDTEAGTDADTSSS